MKLNKYLQGYKDGQEVLIKNIKSFVDKESKFIPNEGFNYLLDEITSILTKEEKALQEKIENVKSSKL